jgi:transglutaminase-like putative cysteine protease
LRRLNIAHLTEYGFSTAVSLQPHRLLLRPRESHILRIESSTLEIAPAHSIRWHRDVLDNSVAVVSFSEPSQWLRIESGVVIEVYADAPLDFLVEDSAVTYPFDYAPAEQADLAPFRQSVYFDDRPMIHGWLHGLGLLQRPIETFVLLDRMNREIAGRFVYQMREEQGVQSPAQTLFRNGGSCRDFAALFIEACRYLGLASRFVSGYLHSDATEAGNASTHAWAEVYLPGPGWKGFDPTSGEVTGNRHIPVAVARHPEAVPPVAGSYIGPLGQRPLLSVSVRVSAAL